MNIRNSLGQFTRKIPSIVIVSLTLMVAVLGIMNHINSERINALEARLTSVNTATLLTVKEGNQMVLDATLGHIAKIEHDRMEDGKDVLNLVEGSVDLTQNLKEQIITKRKSDAL